MKFNFKNLISVEAHNKKIANGIQRIRNEYAKNPNVKQYLDALSEFFLDDIQQFVAKKHKEIIVKANKEKVSIKPLEIAKYLKEDVVNNILPIYRRHLCDYNGGNMFGSYYGNFEEYINSFIKLAVETLEEECNSLEYNFHKEWKKSRYNLIILIIAILTLFFTIRGPVNFNFLNPILNTKQSTCCSLATTSSNISAR